MEKVKVAIMADDGGPKNSSSPIWTRVLQEAGYEIVPVNVRCADILDQVRGCSGFMWRAGHTADDQLIARSLLPVLEHDYGMTVYPDQNTCWHYDNKITQEYLFEAHGIPRPRTWIWFDRQLAIDWARTADWPKVMKLSAGASSENVRKIESADEAGDYINAAFEYGFHRLPYPRWRIWMGRPSLWHPLRWWMTARMAVLGRPSFPYYKAEQYWQYHKNYVYFQEFIPNNINDIRITVIGDRAFGFRRFNREGDFRASGSGRIDHDPKAIEPDALQLAFDVARKLKMQSAAMDILRRADGSLIVVEVSYAYVSWAVERCAGHWDSSLVWHEGHMWPEEAQAADFIERLRERGSERAAC